MTTCIDVSVRSKKNSDEDDKNKKGNKSATIIIILSIVFGSIFLLGIIVTIVVVVVSYLKRKRDVPKISITYPSENEILEALRVKNDNNKFTFEDFMKYAKNTSVNNLRNEGRYNLGNSYLRTAMLEYLSGIKNDMNAQVKDFSEIFNSSSNVDKELFNEEFKTYKLLHDLRNDNTLVLPPDVVEKNVTFKTSEVKRLNSANYKFLLTENAGDNKYNNIIKNISKEDFINKNVDTILQEIKKDDLESFSAKEKETLKNIILISKGILQKQQK